METDRRAMVAALRQRARASRPPAQSPTQPSKSLAQSLKDWAGNASRAGLQSFAEALDGRSSDGKRLGNIVPVAIDEKTGEKVFAMPRILDLVNTQSAIVKLGAASITAGPLVKRALIARSQSVGYNPKAVKPREFRDDYGRVAGSDEAGRLAESIEGVKLDAPFVAGRRVAGGADEGLLGSDITEVSSRIVDDIREAPRSKIAGKAAGQYKETASADGKKREITVASDLKPDQKTRVLAHELGHAIDEIAGQLDTKGLTKELEQVYSDLTTGQQGRTRHKTRPKDLNYPPREVPRELFAEAIRAYMVDPNYLKTVAPKTAAAIRKAVNEDPKIARVIQFNADAPIGIVGKFSDDQEFRRLYEQGGAT